MTSTSIINLGPETKAQIESFAANIIEDVVEGRYDALDIHLKAKAMIASLTLVIEGIEAIAINEAEKNGKTFDYHNAKVEVREVGSKWHYDKTNDSRLAFFSSEKAKLAEKEKERQKMLQFLKEPTKMLDEETGELVTVYPAYKTSKTGLVVTFKEK